MTHWVVALLMLAGASLILITGVGVLRMPDLYTRMQAAAKAGTLGVGCLLGAVVFFFGDVAVATRALLVIAFLFLTAPVAAHMICRAGYYVGVPQWEGTVIDQLRDHLQQEGTDQM